MTARWGGGSDAAAAPLMVAEAKKEAPVTSETRNAGAASLLPLKGA